MKPPYFQTLYFNILRVLLIAILASIPASLVSAQEPSQPGPFAEQSYDNSDYGYSVNESGEISEKKQNPKVEPSSPTSSQDAAIKRLEKQILEMQEQMSRMKEEAEIRNQLSATEEEQKQSEEEILSAVSRAYTLMRPGFLGFEYAFSYAANTYDSLIQDSEGNKIEHIGNHTLTNSFLIEYPLKENITLGLDVPFVYKFDNGTYGSMSTTDIGDVSLSAQWQPVKSGGDRVSPIINFNLSMPSGRSPYKIDPTQGLATGSGGFAATLGASVSKSIDPLVAFSSLAYTYYMPMTGLRYQVGTQGEAGIYLQKVTPGDSIAFSMGLGYSISYKVSLSLSWSYSYRLETDYDWVGTSDSSSEDTINSTFNISTGWRVTPKRTVNTRLGFGLTNNDTDVTLQIRVPFQYEL